MVRRLVFALALFAAGLSTGLWWPRNPAPTRSAPRVHGSAEESGTLRLRLAQRDAEIEALLARLPLSEEERRKILAFDTVLVPMRAGPG